MFDLRYTNDIVLLIWIGLVAFFCGNAKKKRVTILGQEEERYTLPFAIIVFFPIFWFVITVIPRSDMWLYISGFKSFNQSIFEVLENWNSFDKGPGFLLIESTMKAVGITGETGFRVVIALLQSIPLVYVYWKYSEDYVYSIFLFIATLSYDGWMMNGIRQFLAACIVFAAFPFFLKRRYIPTLLFVLIAISIHSSAIVMIPVLLISQFKPWSKITIILIFGFGAVLFFYIYNSNWLSEETLQKSTGSNPLGILFRAVPAVIAFIGRKQIAAKQNRLLNICVNISVITVVMNVVASMTSGVMAGRLAGYTTIFSYILLPYLLKKTFNEAISKKLFVSVTIYYVLSFVIKLYFFR